MPTVHAEADTSSILITPSVPTVSQVAIPVAPMVSESPNIVTESTPVNTPIINASQASTVEASYAPAITASEPLIVSTPVQTAPMIAPQPTPIINFEPIAPVAPTPMIQPAPTPAVTNSIFDSIMGNTEPAPSMIHPEASMPSVAEVPLATVTIAESAPVPAPAAFVPTPAPVAAFVPTPPSTPVPQISTQTAATHNFSTPREFIEKSIANIDNMLVNIDSRHSAKEIEEESYRIEKLRFTDLEKNAHTEKIIMDKERDHAIHMRKILETELERDKANKEIEEASANHVESTLSEIGTEHPIHRHAHKKAESHPQEDAPVTA